MDTKHHRGTLGRPALARAPGRVRCPCEVFWHLILVFLPRLRGFAHVSEHSVHITMSWLTRMNPRMSQNGSPKSSQTRQKTARIHDRNTSTGKICENTASWRIKPLRSTTVTVFQTSKTHNRRIKWEPEWSPKTTQITMNRKNKNSENFKSQGCKQQSACWNQNGTILSHWECPPNNKNPANPEKPMQWVRGPAWIIQSDATKITLFRNSECVLSSFSWQMNWKVITNPLSIGSVHSRSGLRTTPVRIRSRLG